MQFQELLERIVGRESLNAIVGNSVLCPTVGTFDESLDIIDQTLHAGLHTKGVLTWQKLWVVESFATNRAGEQFVEFLHFV